MKVMGGTATAVRAWAVEQYQVAAPSGSAVAGIAVDTHHAPGAKVPGAGWSSQLFLSPANPSQVLCGKTGVRTAGMGSSSTWAGQGALGYEYLELRTKLLFFSLPRSGWGRNSATDGPTKA